MQAPRVRLHDKRATGEASRARQAQSARQMNTQEPGQPARQLPPPGWYDDPSGSGQRYWDGAQWTDHYKPVPAQQVPAPPPPIADDGKGGGTALVFLGYVFAIVMPFIGLILGIIAATRPRGRPRRNGPWIIALSAVVFAAWVALFVAAVEQSNHKELQNAKHAVRKVTHAIEKSSREIKHAEKEAERKAGQEQQAVEEAMEREEAEADRKAHEVGG